MRRVALVVLAAFLGLAAASAQDQSQNAVPLRTVSKRSYKKGKKVRRSKAGHRKGRKRVARRPQVV